MTDLDERARERTNRNYYHAAIQYHVAARFAVQARLGVVAGILGHYAAEMYLKGYLSRHLSEADLIGVGHDLRKAWARWVKLSGVSDLYVERAILRLQPFWDIRYPETVVQNGMRLRVGPFLEPMLAAIEMSERLGAATSSIPEYVFVLEDLDRLADLVLRTGEVNPMFFFAGLSDPARQALTLNNRTTTWAERAEPSARRSQ